MSNLLEKTEQEIIQDIHNDFDSACDKILQEANSIIENAELIDKLKDLGFISTPLVKQKEQKQHFKRITETVNYYKQKYPFNKFIPVSVVEEICKKYNLICGSSENYIGEIPMKNINEILNFKLYDEDRPETDNRTWFSSSWGNDTFGNLFLSEGTWCEEKKVESGKTKITLRICAPSSCFNTTGMDLKDGYLLVNDPIVLQPVKGGYLIISKWGLEASDGLLLNEIQN